MKAIGWVLVSFFGSALSAGTIECTFAGLAQDYEPKFVETVPYNLEDDIGSSGELGPYKIELLVYEGDFKIGVEIAGNPISGFQIPIEKVNETPTGKTVFGSISAYHTITDGFISLKYECLMAS